MGKREPSATSTAARRAAGHSPRGPSGDDRQSVCSNTAAAPAEAAAPPRTYATAAGAALAARGFWERETTSVLAQPGDRIGRRTLEVTEPARSSRKAERGANSAPTVHLLFNTLCCNRLLDFSGRAQGRRSRMIPVRNGSAFPMKARRAPPEAIPNPLDVRSSTTLQRRHPGSPVWISGIVKKLVNRISHTVFADQLCILTREKLPHPEDRRTRELRVFPLEDVEKTPHRCHPEARPLKACSGADPGRAEGSGRGVARHGRGSVLDAGSPRSHLVSGGRRCRAASAAGHACPRLDPSALRSPARPHGTVRSGLRMTPVRRRTFFNRLLILWFSG